MFSSKGSQGVEGADSSLFTQNTCCPAKVASVWLREFIFLIYFLIPILPSPPLISACFLQCCHLTSGMFLLDIDKSSNSIAQNEVHTKYWTSKDDCNFGQETWCQNIFLKSSVCIYLLSGRFWACWKLEEGKDSTWLVKIILTLMSHDNTVDSQLLSY